MNYVYFALSALAAVALVAALPLRCWRQKRTCPPCGGPPADPNEDLTRTYYCPRCGSDWQPWDHL